MPEYSGSLAQIAVLPPDPLGSGRNHLWKGSDPSAVPQCLWNELHAPNTHVEGILVKYKMLPLNANTRGGERFPWAAKSAGIWHWDGIEIRERTPDPATPTKRTPRVVEHGPQPAQSIPGALGTAGVTPPETTSCRKGLEARGSSSPGIDPKAIPGDTGRASCHSHPARIGGSSCPGAIKIPFAGTISFLLCPHTAIKTELLETGRKNHFPLGFKLFPDFFPSINLHIFHLPHQKHGNFSPFPLPPKIFCKHQSVP